MLNASEAVNTLPSVIEYVDAKVATAMANGAMNTGEAQVIAHMTSAIRRGHPQLRPHRIREERVCLVGSGPSLNDSLETLRTALWEGSALVTMNGAYHWCLEHNLRPQTQIVMDARPANARFVVPAVPKCNYLLASQCAPEVWDAVEGRPHVWIFHPLLKSEGPASTLLDTYYGGNWVGVGGGTTVASRAIHLLRQSGYVNFELFGIDCCWRGMEHHALTQPENRRDDRFLVRVGAVDSSESREFWVASWMLKQLEDMLTVMALNGKHFTLTMHGDGLLAYILCELGTCDIAKLVMTPSEVTEEVGAR